MGRNETWRNLFPNEQEFYDKVDVNFNRKEAEKINAFKRARGDADRVQRTIWEKKMTKKKLFNDKITLVKTTKLTINPHQTYYYSDASSDTKKRDHLLASIKKYGIKDPIKITQDFIIIGGHRRHNIALELELEMVPCQIVSYKLTGRELKLHTLEDNYLQRGIGSGRQKLIYADMVEMIKKEFPNWEYLIRDDNSKFQAKLEAKGLSRSAAEKISVAERRKAKRADNVKRRGVNITDINSMRKSLEYLVSRYGTSNKKTKAEIYPEIVKALATIKKKKP